MIHKDSGRFHVAWFLFSKLKPSFCDSYYRIKYWSTPLEHVTFSMEHLFISSNFKIMTISVIKTGVNKLEIKTWH